MSSCKEFDFREIYDKEIKKKHEELFQLCNTYGIPFVSSIAVKNTPEDTEYEHRWTIGVEDFGFTNPMIREYVTAMTGGKFMHPDTLTIQNEQEYINTEFDDEEPKNGKGKDVLVETKVSADNDDTAYLDDGDLKFN